MAGMLTEARTKKCARRAIHGYSSGAKLAREKISGKEGKINHVLTRMLLVRSIHMENREANWNVKKEEIHRERTQERNY